MEIKNKNILLNLHEGEEIVYVAKKDVAVFYIFFTIIIFICGYLTFLLTWFFPMISNYHEIKFIILGIILVIFLFGCIIYKYVLDYFFTDVVLTNQRLILLINKRTISIKYEDINHISNCLFRGPEGIRIVSEIKLTSFLNPLFNNSNKHYTVHFINYESIKNKLDEISSNKTDVIYKMTLKETLIMVFFLILLVIANTFLRK